MTHETTLIYNEQIIRQAVFGFWYRSIGGAAFIVTLILLALIFGWSIAQGKIDWFVGVTGSFLVMGVQSVIALYLVHYRGSLRKFREMGSPQATFCVNESTFTVTSGIGTSTLQWSAVKELWRFSSAWLLLYSKTQFSILPLHCLLPEMQTFIVQRIQSEGGKVVG